MKNVGDAGFSRKRGGNAESGPPPPPPFQTLVYAASLKLERVIKQKQSESEQRRWCGSKFSLHW